MCVNLSTSELKLEEVSSPSAACADSSLAQARTTSGESILLPLTHSLRSQIEAYQRVAWFVFECVEREHLLTLKALAAPAVSPGLGWLAAWQPFALVVAPSWHAARASARR
jgi:hypothetical protein